MRYAAGSVCIITGVTVVNQQVAFAPSGNGNIGNGTTVTVGGAVLLSQVANAACVGAGQTAWVNGYGPDGHTTTGDTVTLYVQYQ